MIPDNVAASGERMFTSDWNASYRNYLYRMSASKINVLSGNGSTAQAAAVDTVTTLVVGTLYHVAIVRDGNTLRIFLNGVQDASGDITGYTGGSTSLNRYIGADSALTSTTMYDGLMCDYREYTRALSANEIATIYNCRGHDGVVYGLELKESMTFMVAGSYWGQNEKRSYPIPTPSSFIYYRLYITDQEDTLNSLCIAEIELLNESEVDQTAGQTFTASSSNASYPPSYAFDDIITGYNYWLPNNFVRQSSPSWIKVRFSEAKTIHTLTLRSRNFSDWHDMPVKFVLQGSNDDATWVDLLRVIGVCNMKYTRDDSPKQYELLSSGFSYAPNRISMRKRRR